MADGAAKTVLITGATDGLGRATAVYLAERGYRVFAGGRSAEKRASLEKLARERKLPIEVMEMDVCDDASVERAVAATESRAAIGVLINNAGYALCATMEDVTLEDLRAQFETNFFGVVRVTQSVLPHMRSRHRGRIINMSSIAGKYSWPLFGPYSASKFALEGMSDALRIEARLYGIQVVLIEPGYIPTNMSNVSQELGAQYQKAAIEGPYARLYARFRENWKNTMREPKYTPEDCARVIQRAIETPRPKPRYTVTQRAALLSFAKRVVPDSYFDKRTLRAFGIGK